MQETLSMYKTAICHHYQEKGYCSMKEKCHFAHGQQQVRSPTDPVPANISAQLKPVSLYKTQLCKYFSKGYCKNKGSCTYAHGSSDIQSMPVVPVAQSTQRPSLTPAPISCPPPVYPMYMVPVPVMVPVPAPPMNATTGNVLTVIQNLCQVFPENEEVQMLLKGAREFALAGQTDKAKGIVHEIHHDPARSSAEKEKVKKIMSNMMFLSSLNTMRSPFLNNTYDI